MVAEIVCCEGLPLLRRIAGLLMDVRRLLKLRGGICWKRLWSTNMMVLMRSRDSSTVGPTATKGVATLLK